jgi:hypothetical protein
MLREIIPMFILAFLLITISAYADTGGSKTNISAPDGHRPWKESGLSVGYGVDSIPEGKYEAILLIWHLAYDLEAYLPILKNHRGILVAVCEPQVNPVVQPETEVEFGVGIGLKYLYPLTDRIYPYLQGTTGPHYISVRTEDQHRGFLFANTIAAGLYYFLSERTAINVNYRFRHMSNAGLKRPNGGIDTHSGVVGISFFFGH